LEQYREKEWCRQRPDYSHSRLVGVQQLFQDADGEGFIRGGELGTLFTTCFIKRKLKSETIKIHPKITKTLLAQP